MVINKLICFKYLFTILLIHFEFYKFIETISVSTKCEIGEFYDPNLYACSTCPENMIPSKDSKILFH